jgi:DNA invertase Pin-like site-specific DNA recombinase
MSTPKRVIGLLRVSGDRQDVERQRRDLARLKETHNLTFIRILELEDVSGRTVLENADVQQALRDLKRPDVHGFAVAALDRLFRPDEFGDFAILDYFRRSTKLIFSAKENVIDPSTDMGFQTCLMSGAMAGLEWRMLRQRTRDGKEVLRQRGGNPNGSLVLPRGVAAEPLKDAKGRTIGAKWSYEEPDAGRIKKAYDLLFQRLSWRDIAAQIGGGWTYNGIRLALRNPLWKGTRVYTKGREEPLEIQVIDKPLISPARWQQAQELILQKHSRWLKTKRPPSNLLSGLLECGCGAPVYVRMSGSGTYYYCSAKCGAKSAQQPAADRVVEEFVSNLDAKFWTKAFAQMRTAQPARDDAREKLDRQREKLESERQRLLRLCLKGTIAEEDFGRESKRIAAEVRDLDLLAPAPVADAIDPKKTAAHVARTFARFGRQPFEEKRAALRTVFKDLVLDNGNVAGFTVNSAFLDRANSSPRCSAW